MKNWSNWRKANHTFFWDVLGDLPRESKLVDIGSGKEQFADIFRQFPYRGLDHEAYYPNTIVCDVSKGLLIPDGDADIITLSNTIEHIPDTSALLKECRRVLCKGGILVATVPFVLGEHQLPHDYNRYTHVQLERLCRAAGFENVSVMPLGKQIDVYNSIELKVFDELKDGSLLFKVIRTWRRLEMRLLCRLFTKPAGNRITEGYGVICS